MMLFADAIIYGPKKFYNTEPQVVRRSESFQHNHEIFSGPDDIRHSSQIFRFAISRPTSTTNEMSRPRGKSVERMLDEKLEAEVPKPRPLHKSKSMEFLKAKLLSRKGTQKLSPHNNSNNNMNNNNNRQASRSQSPGFNNNSQHQHWSNDHQHRAKQQQQHQRDQYDWRQDTPFWNHRGRWTRPAPLTAAKPKMSGSVHGASTLSPFHKMLHSNFPPNQVPPGGPLAAWPGRQYPGMFVGSSAFYPRPFAIASPTNPKNVSHNMFLAPPTMSSPQHRFGAPHPSFAAAVAQAAAQAAQAAAAAAAQSKLLPHDDDLPSRLEITELSDGDDDDDEGVEGDVGVIDGRHLPIIPSPDYSTMRSSPAESVNTVIHMSTLSKGKGHILDIPSGLY